jgi:hypothetical protein
MIGGMNSAKVYVLRGSTLPGIATAITIDEPRIDQERAISWLQHE